MPVERELEPRVVLYGVTVGASAYSLLKGQLSWLQDHGWRVCLAASPDDEAKVAAEREGVRLYPLPMTRSITPLSDLCALIRWVRLIHRLKPAAVNASTPKAGFLGTLAAWMLRVPKRIYVVRGLRLEGVTGPLAWVLWLMERVAMACSTDVVFVGPSLAEQAVLRGLGGRGKGWVVRAGSSNGVDVCRVVARAEEIPQERMRDDLGLEEHDFVVGYVGRVTSDKGVDTLITAFEDARLPLSAKLVVVGWVEDEQLRGRLATLGDRVRTVGSVRNVPAHMATMNVLCLPTKREGFPNVVLEAAALRIPVITSRATGSIDSVVDGETGILMDVDDHRALARALEQLHADPEWARTLGDNAHQRVVRDFKPIDIWRGVLAIMQSEYGAAGLHQVVERGPARTQKEAF